MKLATHYNKASIIITISVLLTGAVIYYFAIKNIARNQLDHDLSEEIEEVISYVNINQKLPRQVDFDEDITLFIKTKQQSMPAVFYDTIYNNPKEKKPEPGRAIAGIITLKGEHYKVIITESKESTEYLVQIITIITLVLMVVLLAILAITNRYILNGLWRPFYDTLTRLKVFNIADADSLYLKPNNVDEFTDLNNVVSIMSSRVINDYRHLKQFTENASHEMMTPLAVITSKLDTLIQDENLRPEHYEQINDIYAAASKLSRLNHSLLLLVKIENNLVDDAVQLNLEVLISQKTRHFQELILAKNIDVVVNSESKSLLASKYLIDILLNNLFSNAIRHNIPQGKIFITLTDKEMVFQNSGQETTLDKAFLFERFQKGHQSEGTGLGLTIVKNICTLYKWDITYYYENALHTFSIKF